MVMIEGTEYVSFSDACILLRKGKKYIVDKCRLDGIEIVLRPPPHGGSPGRYIPAEYINSLCSPQKQHITGKVSVQNMDEPDIGELEPYLQMPLIDIIRGYAKTVKYLKEMENLI